MSIFAIADLHLSFGVQKPMDVFGAGWKDHPDRLRQAWSCNVKSDDLVIIPGDISWGIDLDEAKPDLDFIHSLPGKKLLLRGNHDYWWASLKKMEGLYDDIFFLRNNAFEWDDAVIAGSRGWSLPWAYSKEFTLEENEKVFKRELLRMEMSLQEAQRIRNSKKLIAVSHYPPLDREHTGTRVTELYQKYGVDTAVYGHLHAAQIFTACEGRIGGIEYRLVSLDKLDCVPLKLI